MDVSVVGSGYVGTTLAGCLADCGHTVTAIDIDSDIVTQLCDGNAPIHEPGLYELVGAHAGERLTATTDYDAIRNTDVTFLTISTPSNDDGSIDTAAVEAGAESIGDALREKEKDHLVVVKSTVVPGTTEDVLVPAIEAAANKTVGDGFDVATNPEFLREGSAVNDFLHPDKIVFGTRSTWAENQLDNVFKPVRDRISGETPIVRTGIREAEMIKYANNAFLATKVSFINEIGNICKEYNVDTYEIADALGLDHRINPNFLESGLGWGGSCFPKDIDALIAAAEATGYNSSLLKAVVEVNEKQPHRMLELLQRRVDPKGKRIAVLGLSFKPGTDDVRGSRAIPIIEELLDAGADVVAYDPTAADQMHSYYPNISYTDSASKALAGSSAALLVTEWDEFNDLDGIEGMERQILIDGRRQLHQLSDKVVSGLTW